MLNLKWHLLTQVVLRFVIFDATKYFGKIYLEVITSK